MTHETDPDDAPSGLPDEQEPDTPLAPPDPDADAMPGIPEDGEPPASA